VTLVMSEMNASSADDNANESGTSKPFTEVVISDALYEEQQDLSIKNALI